MLVDIILKRLPPLSHTRPVAFPNIPSPLTYILTFVEELPAVNPFAAANTSMAEIPLIIRKSFRTYLYIP